MAVVGTLPESEGDDRPAVYQDPDGTWVYRASSVGRSMRCLVQARNGYTPLPTPQYLLDASARGIRLEPVVKGELRDLGWGVSGEQLVVELVVREEPRVIIRGHLDAEYAVAPGTLNQGLAKSDHPFLEVKTMSPNVWKEWIAHRFRKLGVYAAQVTCYQEAVGGRPFAYAVRNAVTKELDVNVWSTPPNFPITYSEIAQKVLICEWFGEQDILPICTGSLYTCEFDYNCDKRDALFEELEAGGDLTLMHLASRYKEVKRLEADVELRAKEFRDEIMTALGKRKKVQVGEYIIQRVPGSKSSLDVKGLRDRLGDDLDQYYRTTHYESLRVSQKETT
jgi:hypothetical protein